MKCGSAVSTVVPIQAKRPGAKFVPFLVETNSNYSGSMNYRVRTVGPSGQFNFDFVVPPDFVSLDYLVIVGAPNADFISTDTLFLDSDYGGIGQNVENISEAASYPVAGVQDVWQAFDLAVVFTQIKGGDLCGFNLNHVNIGTAINYHSVWLSYFAA